MPNSSAIAEWPHRSRLLEYFESVAEYPEHSGVWDLNELINEWDMIVDSPLERSAFPCPPYTGQLRSSRAGVYLSTFRSFEGKALAPYAGDLWALVRRGHAMDV
jgi:hypothetical protein